MHVCTYINIQCHDVEFYQQTNQSFILFLPCQQEMFLLWEDNLANCKLGKMLNSRQYSLFSCEFSYLCLFICWKFLIHTFRHCPFFHNGFYHWLYVVINSINLWGGYGLCQRSTWAWQNSITITKTIIFFMRWSTLKYLNSANLLMPKVNISR